MKNIFIFLFLMLAFFCQAQIILPVKTFRTPTARPIELITFDPSGKLIGVDSEGYLFVFDTKTGSLQKILRAHEQNINGIAFSPDGKSMATVGDDHKIFLWDNDTGNKVNTINVNGQTSFMVFSTNGNSLFFAADSGLYTTRVGQAKNPSLIHNTHQIITSGVVSKDKKIIALGNGGNISLFSLDNQSPPKNIKCCDGNVIGIDLAKTGNVACLCDEGVVNILELAVNNKIGSFHAEKDSGQLAFSNNGKFLVSCNHGNEPIVWKVAEQKTITTLKGHTAAVRAVAFSGDYKYFATGSNDGIIKLWQIEDKEDENTSATLPIEVLNKILENRKIEDQSTLNASAETIDIFIWDDENVDGDTISLNLNGDWILKEYGLTKTRKKLTLTLKPGKNELILFAHNLGKDSPNTAAITFMEGNKERTLTLNSDLGNCGAINFIYEK